MLGWSGATVRSGAGGLGERGTGPAHLGDRVERPRVGGVEVVVGVHVGDHGDRVLEVIERDQRVGQHQRQVGRADRVRVRLAQRLDGADQVVGEQTDGAPGEGRQVGQRRRPEPAEFRRRQGIGIAAVAQ
jgi:hypothetical protein